MQELRLVLIIVGLLAIAALLFHGLWTSKKEGKAKFGNKPHRKLESSEEEEQDYTATRAFAPEDDFEIIRKTRKEPEFADNTEKEVPAYDPLVDSEEPLPSFSSIDDDSSKSKENEPVESVLEPEAFVAEPQETEQISVDQTTDFENEERNEEPVITEPEPEAEKEMEVLVLNVHCAGDDPFVGTSLFDSMKQNGLLYGEMDIFHRHADLSGTGKVLFSVANMMQPGTLQHDDPDTFTTQGISFFMTLPCFGEADQNFKLMLKTAQQIADDLGGNVLDDQRNLMTPDRLDAYRQQIRDFNAG